MKKNILIIQGHPDPSPDRFGQVLANAYIQGAKQAGHTIRTIDIATLDFPVLRTREQWEHAEPPPSIKLAQQEFLRAEHIVFIYPLWLGDIPALFKAFLEQVMRPGYAFGNMEGKMPSKLLKGRSARVVVTMGMPASVYRVYYRAHSLKSLERNILHFVGISPVRKSVIGMVEGNPVKRQLWLAKMQEAGREGI